MALWKEKRNSGPCRKERFIWGRETRAQRFVYIFLNLYAKISSQDCFTLYEIVFCPFRTTFSVHFLILVTPYFHTHFYETCDSWGSLFIHFKQTQSTTLPVPCWHWLFCLLLFCINKKFLTLQSLSVLANIGKMTISRSSLLFDTLFKQILLVYRANWQSNMCVPFVKHTGLQRDNQSSRS